MIATFFVAIAIRLTYALFETGNGRPLPASSQHPPSSTLIVLGSGGHTAEMLNLVRVLKRGRVRPRYYIAAATDTLSLDKAELLEESESESKCEPGGVQETEDVHFTKIYCSREVGQSYLTSIGTTLIATAHALWLILKIRPEMILCSGPGTCIPLCAVALLLKVLGIWWSSIFYVESIARVRKFSLSGLILYKSRMEDQIFVQWPQLQNRYPRVHYVGCLM